MIITYTQDVSDYLDQEEIKKLKNAITSFVQLVQHNQDAPLLNGMHLTVGVNNSLKDKGNNPVPAESSLQNLNIDFNIDCCKVRFTDHYMSLFAHEVGHIFPQLYPERKLFQNYVLNPDFDAVDDPELAHIKRPSIPKFESNKNPYKEFVADYYACSWVGKEIYIELRRLNSNQRYIKVIDKHPNEDEFRVEAYLYFR